MQKTLTPIALAVALAMPAVTLAKPDQAEKAAAKAQCKAERGHSSATREAFKAKYHSFRACVRSNAAEEEAENETAHENAAKECKAERAAGRAAFQALYGTNKNDKNAFGKCVSGKATAKKAEMDGEDAEEAKEFRNAAKACAAERGMGRQAFTEKYGTNENGSNAFGKCVSATARES
jgi:hypothetical protein